MIYISAKRRPMLRLLLITLPTLAVLSLAPVVSAADLIGHPPHVLWGHKRTRAAAGSMSGIP